MLVLYLTHSLHVCTVICGLTSNHKFDYEMFSTFIYFLSLTLILSKPALDLIETHQSLNYKRKKVFDNW
jgi:hypothetical protein